MSEHEVELVLDDVFLERDIEVGAPEVAVPLRDLVLEDEVIAERVPGELAGEAVVLVAVVARVREHEIGVDAFQILEDLLDSLADVRHERVPEPVDDDLGAGRARQEVLGARPRLALPVTVRAEHDPRDLEVGVVADQREDGAAATDLDVVRMAADRQQASKRRLAAEEREREHQASLGSRSACDPTLRQGARPDSWSPSSRCRSLIVSIGPKNPSYGYATTSPRGMRRENVSSTSSSPGSIHSRSSLRHTKKPPLIRTSESFIDTTG